MTPLQFALTELYAFQEATSCNTAEELLAQQALQPKDCPKCKGSEFPGIKRGVRCSACEGSGEVS